MRKREKIPEKGKKGGGVAIPPQELRRIVEAYGGPEAFAPLIGVKPRFVYYLLAGKRKLSPRTEMLVRQLERATRGDGRLAGSEVSAR